MTHLCILYTHLYKQSYGPISAQLVDQMYLSAFCLVTKADSYSTAFFYDAIQSGCIPVVISNWFIFSFPTFIPYDTFTIRIEENDFLKDPNGCLDAVLSMISIDKRKEMVKSMYR